MNRAIVIAVHQTLKQFNHEQQRISLMKISSTTSQNQAQEKLLFLDGIRGFAALWVLTSHCLSYVDCKAFSLLQRGDLAVDVFMIMSGFLMCYQYHRREAKEPWDSISLTWKNFYIRRFFRIAPLYYLLLIFSLIFNDFFAQNREFINTIFPSDYFVKQYGSAANFFDHKYMGFTFTNFLTHLTFLFGLLPKYATATALPDWSIGLEMQFYAVFPMLMLAFRKLSYVWNTALLLGIGILFEKAFKVFKIAPPGFATPFPLPSFLFLSIEFFLIGILLAVAYVHRQNKPSLSVWVGSFALLLSACQGSTLIFYISIFIALFLFYDDLADPLRIKRIVAFPKAILSSKTATFMADTSYSVYLTHTLIMAPLAAALIQVPGYISLPPVIRFAALFTVTLPITYGISQLLFQYVEKPGIWLGKQLQSKITFEKRLNS